MKETWKTWGFVGAAVLIVSIAWLSRPMPPTPDAEDLREQRLFPDFDDPLAATSMEIVEFDEATAEVRPFTVAQVDVKGEGKPRWSIPTHENYPADARDQVADAASGVMGLTILEVAGSSPSDHELYGVVDPDSKRLSGTTGVGTRVTMKDKRGRVLMSLIIGKEVADRTGLRYVRKAGEKPVYVVKISTSRLSSKFEDWIEKDLLKLNAWDIKQIQIRDHSVDEFNMRLIQRGNMTLEYDDTAETKWTLTKDEVFRERDQKWVPLEMAPDEELDTAKLDEMRNALDDLKIVDVTRKPPGLSADLKAEKGFLDNDEALASLMSRGFFPTKMEGRIELVSNEGEIRCLMKDGVEYVLRFGEITGIGPAASEKSEKKADEDEDASSSPGMNRYIFVMAEFNADVIPRPELVPLPEEEKEPADAAPAEGETSEGGSGTDQPTADQPPDQSPKEMAQEEEDLNGEQKAVDQPAGEDPDGESAEEDADEDQSAQPEEKETDDAQADDNSEAAAKRAEIEKENRRKQDEYEGKLEEGRKKVEELNNRFADWYYVISDEVYQQIHLGRDQIIKEKEQEGAGEEDGGDNVGQPEEPISPIGEFNRLKQEGPAGGP